MDASTKSLQKSSEAQLKVAESQARAINNLLKSSRTIEQFSLFLIVLTIVNLFIVEYVLGTAARHTWDRNSHRTPSADLHADGDCLSLAEQAFEED